LDSLAGQETTSNPGASDSTDFFDAPTYSQWVRGTLKAASERSDVEVLFDSTMREPTQALLDVIRDGFEGGAPPQYASVFAGGNRQLIDELAKRYGLPPQWILPTTGVTAGLAMVLRALIEPGDHVLVEQPGFDLLTRLSQEAGAVVTPLRRPAPDFGIDLAQMEHDLTPRTRAVILTNLHNPSGRRLTPAEIRAVARLARAVGAWVIVDEVYDDFARGLGVYPALPLGSNIVGLNSLSKVYGLFSLRCGWIVAQPELLARIQGGAAEGDSGVSKLTHAVATLVLQRAQVFETHWFSALAANREVLLRHVETLRAEGLIEGQPPAHGCMFFPRVVGQDDTLALSRTLWREHRVIVAPGEYFGLAGHVRIGFGGDPASLDRGLERLRQGLLAARSA
jgi:aspartate/methionine/tyrosine aminotransferase